MSEKQENQSCSFRTTIGGQALIEGILMRGPERQAIVVRAPEGLVVREEELKLIRDRYPILGLPLIRGRGTSWWPCAFPSAFSCCCPPSWPALWSG